MKSPALITVTAESGQAAANNIAGMWKRLQAPSRRRAVWIASEDVEEQLDRLVEAIGAGGIAVPCYQPAGTNGSLYPLLKGRPVIPVEQCPPLGTSGDLILADLAQYILIDGGIRPALSAEVRFNSDELVWRFVLRIDGRPTYSSPITPYNGSVTRSPFVALASRT
jgi:HK97 family phage major capsid protein